MWTDFSCGNYFEKSTNEIFGKYNNHLNQLMKRNKSVILISILLLVMNFNLQGLAQGFGDKILFNENWSFRLGDIEYGGIEFLDHSTWRVLNLPHDWGVEGIASAKNSSWGHLLCCS